MQYYSISPDLYCYPQIKGFGDTIFISNPKHIFHFLDKYAGVRFTTSPPKWAPHLDYLVLNPRLKKKGPSDLLSEPFNFSNGFIISDKFKTLLEGFTLSPHVYYPCRVGLGGVFWDYYYLFFYGHLGTNIDYSQSPVLTFEWFKDKIIERIIFTSFSEYRNYFKKINPKHNFRFEKIVFKNETPVYDMMNINIVGSNEEIISERLMQEITTRKISNVRFEKLEENYILYQQKVNSSLLL